jgi:hypothetical protein
VPFGTCTVRSSIVTVTSSGALMRPPEAVDRSWQIRRTWSDQGSCP